MAQIRLGIGQVNITDYLIVRARKTTTPLVVEAQEVFDPPQPATQNVVVPAVGSIDPVIYYVDFYESANGVTLDLLLSQFQYDLKNNIILSERRFYVADGPGPNDPPANQDTLTDAYLDGKTISGVFKEGFRYLRPETEPIPEWEVVAGGGVRLLNGSVFSGGEVFSVEISYQVPQASASSGGGLYSGVMLIDTNTVLSITHRNKRLRAEAAAGTTLAITMEALGSVPDGTFYHFTSNAGTQYQTRVFSSGLETIRYNNENYPELWVGKGEFLRIVKTGTFWEAELSHENNLQVGQRFAGVWKDHPSCKPEDATLYNGDEWPRLWWWLKNKLPSTHYVVDDAVIGGGYVHPANRRGQYVLHSTLKFFRVPNTQNLSERGLKNFNTYNADAERPYDYPGGFQDEMVGPHVHPLPRDGDGVQDIQSLVNTSNSDEGITNNSLTGNNSGTENRVKNAGYIYMIKF